MTDMANKCTNEVSTDSDVASALVAKVADAVVQMSREEKVVFIVFNGLTPTGTSDGCRNWFTIERWMNRQILHWVGERLMTHGGDTVRDMKAIKK